MTRGSDPGRKVDGAHLEGSSGRPVDVSQDAI
jgi:hypothetical protein